MHMLAAAGRSEHDLECGAQTPSNREVADELLLEGIEPRRDPQQLLGQARRVHLRRRAPRRGGRRLRRPRPSGAARGDGDPVGDDRHAARRPRARRRRLLDPDLRDPARPPRARLRPVRHGDRTVARRGRRRRGGCSMRARRSLSWSRDGTGSTPTRSPAFGGRLIVKGGAEGVYCAGFPEAGLGVAIKCDDGAGRASEVVMAAAIDALLPLTDAERAGFAHRLTPPVMNRPRREGRRDQARRRHRRGAARRRAADGQLTRLRSISRLREFLARRSWRGRPTRSPPSACRRSRPCWRPRSGCR